MSFPRKVPLAKKKINYKFRNRLLGGGLAYAFGFGAVAMHYGFFDKVLFEEFKPGFIWLETPTNPLLKISDISEIAKAAKKIKAKLAVDNTFMTPYLQRPIDLGADIVLHSMTKYLNGHSDALGGAIMLNDKGFMEKLRYHQNSLGPSLSPFDSWLVLRGLKTLSVRMEQHQKNAKEIAKFLEGHSCVEFVIYPGLKSHPQYRVGKKQTSGPGGMISFCIKGNLRQTKKWVPMLALLRQDLA